MTGTTRSGDVGTFHSSLRIPLRRWMISQRVWSKQCTPKLVASR